MSWEAAWQEGRTHWDEGASPPALTRLLRERAFPPGRVLVPGCGAGYDLITLAATGRPAVGLDVAPSARARFEQLRGEHGVAASDATLLVQDFFEYEPDRPFDIVWDYTFLCAIEPAQRSAWAEHMHTLVRPGGTIFTLLFPLEPIHSDPNRPPYPIPLDAVRPVVSPWLDEVEVRDVEESHPSRRGNELLVRWRRPE
jgi:SAM-dependent methyltransferase